MIPQNIARGIQQPLARGVSHAQHTIPRRPVGFPAGVSSAGMNRSSAFHFNTGANFQNAAATGGYNARHNAFSPFGNMSNAGGRVPNFSRPFYPPSYQPQTYTASVSEHTQRYSPTPQRPSNSNNMQGFVQQQTHNIETGRRHSAPAAMNASEHRSQAYMNNLRQRAMSMPNTQHQQGVQHQQGADFRPSVTGHLEALSMINNNRPALGSDARLKTMLKNRDTTLAAANEIIGKLNKGVPASKNDTAMLKAAIETMGYSEFGTSSGRMSKMFKNYTPKMNAHDARNFQSSLTNLLNKNENLLSTSDRESLNRTNARVNYYFSGGELSASEDKQQNYYGVGGGSQRPQSMSAFEDRLYNS